MKNIAKLTVALFFAIAILSGCNQEVKEQPFILQNGDLLFQDIDGDVMCDAIETVTYGYNGAKFSHVGIAVVDSAGNVQVLEAVSRGVVLNSLEKFFARSADSTGKPKVIVGRVKAQFKGLGNDAVKRAMSYIGKQYDTVFDMANDTYYCSELVQISYKDSAGVPLFGLYPMTFNDPATKTVVPAWKEYYDKMQLAVPEGAAGLSPGSISLSNNIEIVHIYGMPQGMKVESSK